MKESLTALALIVGISGSTATAIAEERQSPIVDDVYHAITTVRDMNSLGVALEAYHMDHGKYPMATSVGELKPQLQPDYAADLESTDAWGTGIKYIPSPDGQGYQLVSAGSDKRFDEATWKTPGVFKDSKEDAVYSRHFIRKWAIDIP